MQETDWADRFSRDVDNLLDEVGPTEPEPFSPEYRQALELARTLATTDFSVESRVRHTLRHRLLNRVGVPTRSLRPKDSGAQTVPWQRIRIATAVALTIFLIVFTTLVWSGPYRMQPVAPGRTSLGEVGKMLAVRQSQGSAQVRLAWGVGPSLYLAYNPGCLCCTWGSSSARQWGQSTQPPLMTSYILARAENPHLESTLPDAIAALPFTPSVGLMYFDTSGAATSTHDSFAYSAVFDVRPLDGVVMADGSSRRIRSGTSLCLLEGCPYLPLILKRR